MISGRLYVVCGRERLYSSLACYETLYERSSGHGWRCSTTYYSGFIVTCVGWIAEVEFDTEEQETRAD